MKPPPKTPSAPLFSNFRYANFVLSHFPDWGWWLLLLPAYALMKGAQHWLDESYAASRFPVSYFVGQTAFDGAKIKSYYAHMIEQGTLEIYIQTQLIDYIFMVTVYIFLFVIGASALRLLPRHRRTGRWGKIAAFMLWFTPLAAASDGLENAVSFVMLANPEGFPNWLAYPYSSFAVIKFALFSVAYLWAGAVLLIAGPVRLLQAIKLKA